MFERLRDPAPRLLPASFFRSSVFQPRQRLQPLDWTIKKRKDLNELKKKNQWLKPIWMNWNSFPSRLLSSVLLQPLTAARTPRPEDFFMHRTVCEASQAPRSCKGLRISSHICLRQSLVLLGFPSPLYSTSGSSFSFLILYHVIILSCDQNMSNPHGHGDLIVFIIFWLSKELTAPEHIKGASSESLRSRFPSQTHLVKTRENFSPFSPNLEFVAIFSHHIFWLQNFMGFFGQKKQPFSRLELRHGPIRAADHVAHMHRISQGLCGLEASVPTRDVRHHFWSKKENWWWFELKTV